MRVYNQNKGLGGFRYRDPATNKRFIIQPGSFEDVPDEIGKKLVAGWPKFLKTDASKSKTEKLRDRSTALAKENAELKAKLEKLQRVVATGVDDEPEATAAADEPVVANAPKKRGPKPKIKAPVDRKADPVTDAESALQSD